MTTTQINNTPVNDFDWNANNMRERVLNCANHPDLRWHTKDLTCRRLHFLPKTTETECQCPISDLRVIN